MDESEPTLVELLKVIDNTHVQAAKFKAVTEDLRRQPKDDKCIARAAKYIRNWNEAYPEFKWCKSYLVDLRPWKDRLPRNPNVQDYAFEVVREQARLHSEYLKLWNAWDQDRLVHSGDPISSSVKLLAIIHKDKWLDE